MKARIIKRSNVVLARNWDRKEHGLVQPDVSINTLRRLAIEMANDHPMLGSDTYHETGADEGRDQ